MFQVNSILTVIGVAMMIKPTSATVTQEAIEQGVIPNVTSTLQRDSSINPVKETLQELPMTFAQGHFILVQCS